MTLALPPAAIEACLPLLLASDVGFSLTLFVAVWRAKPDEVPDLGADGLLIPMFPTNCETYACYSPPLVLLGLPVRTSEFPFKLFNTSSGFHLYAVSVLDLDASLVLLERSKTLPPLQCLDSATEFDGLRLVQRGDRFAGDLDAVS
jgi:hypothetical protein